MSFAEGAVGANKALEVCKFDQPGSKFVEIDNKSSVAAVLSFLRKDGSNHIVPGDTIRSNEPIFDGDSLINTPVKPGTVKVVVTGLSDLLDKYLDGVLYLDRVTDSILSSGTNGVTSGSGFSAAGENFTTDEVVEGDLLVVMDSPDKGSYTVVTSGTTSLTVDRAFPVGGQTGVTYKVLAKDKAAGRLNYFSGEFNLDYPTNIAPAGKASAVGSVAFPIDLSPGDVLTADVDGGGTQNATFDAAQAEAPGDQGATLAASASEDLVVKVAGGADQTVSFGSGTETTAALYASVINSALLDASCTPETNSLNAMIGTLNEMKTDYNAHGASTVFHLVADATNVVAAADASNLATAQTLANEIKADYNAHLTEAGVHANDDVTNAVTAADATDLATLVTLVADVKAQINAHYLMASRLEEAITLVNDVKDMYNAHRILTGGGEHVNADTTNVVAASDATDLATAQTLANEIKADYNLHLAEVSTLSEAMTLLNDIKTQYEAHRVLISGGEHTNADTTDAISAADATDLATAQTLANDIKAQLNAHLIATSDLEEAITLLNDIKAQYEAHRILTAGSVHGGADATNTVSAVDATDLSSAQTLANDLKTQYEAHRVYTTGSVHANPDSTNAISAADATDLATLKALANDLSTQYEAHRVLTAGPVHGAEDTTNVVTADAVGTAAIHGIDDTTNTVSAADATDLATLKTLANELRTDYEAHRVLITGGVHGAADATNVVTAVAVDTAAIHLIADSTNVIAAADATNLATLKTLLDEMRTDYEAHRIDTTSHGAADSTNVITAPAIDTAAVHNTDDLTNTVTSSPNSISIFSDAYGTGASVEVVSGTGTILQKLGLAVGTYSGTGDVVNIDAVTYAEVKAVVEADIKTAVAGDKVVCSLDETGYLRVTNTTANEGASSTLVFTGTARTKFGLDALTHAGDDPDAALGALADYVSAALLAANSRSQLRVPHAASAGDVFCYAAGNGGSGTVRLSF